MLYQLGDFGGGAGPGQCAGRSDSPRAEFCQMPRLGLTEQAGEQAIDFIDEFLIAGVQGHDGSVEPRKHAPGKRSVERLCSSFINHLPAICR